MTATKARKLDHIRICIDSDVEAGDTLLGEVKPVPEPLPELSLSEVDLSQPFLGKELRAPIIVTGMTGGHPAAEEFNCTVASIVEELGLAMGVGSQRAGLEDPKLASTFRAARRCAPSAPIIANIGFAQLASGGVEAALRAVEMIDADAVAVHLNVAQEVFQPEGDRDFRGALKAVARLVEESPVPVVVKETGQGLTYEAALALRSVGVRFLDVSGSGGTSWVRVEELRGRGPLRAAAASYRGWGVPTAASIVEARWGAPDACIIGSGGVRGAADALKAIMLGADAAGVALPVIRAYAAGGAEAVREYLESLILGLKAGAAAVGARRLADLHSGRLVVGSTLASWLEGRGVDLRLVLAARSLGSGRRCA